MIRTVLAVAASALLLAACSEKSPALDIDNPKSLYDLETGAPARVKKGEKGTFTLAVQPKKGAVVKPETPFKTKLSASAPVELAKTEIGYQDHARVEGNGPVFEVPFAAKDAGEGNIEADMVFFVCTDDACVRTTEQVQVPVTVHE